MGEGLGYEIRDREHGTIRGECVPDMGGIDKSGRKNRRGCDPVWDSDSLENWEWIQCQSRECLIMCTILNIHLQSVLDGRIRLLQTRAGTSQNAPYL